MLKSNSFLKRSLVSLLSLAATAGHFEVVYATSQDFDQDFKQTESSSSLEEISEVMPLKKDVWFLNYVGREVGQIFLYGEEELDELQAQSNLENSSPTGSISDKSMHTSQQAEERRDRIKRRNDKKVLYEETTIKTIITSPNKKKKNRSDASHESSNSDNPNDPNQSMGTKILKPELKTPADQKEVNDASVKGDFITQIDINQPIDSKVKSLVSLDSAPEKPIRKKTVIKPVLASENNVRKRVYEEDNDEADDDSGEKAHKKSDHSKGVKCLHSNLVEFLLNPDDMSATNLSLAKKFGVDPGTVTNYRKDLESNRELIEELATNQEILDLHRELTHRKVNRDKFIKGLRRIGIEYRIAEFTLAVLENRHNPEGYREDKHFDEAVEKKDAKGKIPKLIKLIMDPQNNMTHPELAQISKTDKKTVNFYIEAYSEIDHITETANNEDVIAIYEKCVKTYDPETFVNTLIKNHGVRKRVAEIILAKLNLQKQSDQE